MKMNRKVMVLGLVGMMAVGSVCTYAKSCFDTDQVIYEKLMEELEIQKQNPLQYNISFGKGCTHIEERKIIRDAGYSYEYMQIREKRYGIK